MADLNRKGDLDVKIVDGADGSTTKAEIVTDATTAENELLTRDHGYAWAADSSTWEPLQLDTDNRLEVTAFTRPSTAAAADFSLQDPAVPKNGGSSTTDHTITNGKTFTVEKFGGGGYTNQSKVELWFGVPAAGEVGMTLVRALYFERQSSESTVNQDFTGDGTNVLRIKLLNLSLIHI